LGPILFLCYIFPISFIANTFGVGIQQHADDTQLYVSLTPTDMQARQSLLSDCLSALHSWFCHNGLALNSTRSESILIGTRQRLRTLPPIASPIIAGTPVPFSDTIKTLGVTLDQNLTLNKHVSLLSCSIHFYICVLRHIRPALTESMAATLGASLVQSTLDYANSIMECQHLTCTNYSLSKILSLVWFCLLFAIFHYRIQFKIVTLTYKTLATC